MPIRAPFLTALRVEKESVQTAAAQFCTLLEWFMNMMPTAHPSDRYIPSGMPSYAASGEK